MVKGEAGWIPPPGASRFEAQAVEVGGFLPFEAPFFADFPPLAGCRAKGVGRWLLSADGGMHGPIQGGQILPAAGDPKPE